MQLVGGGEVMDEVPSILEDVKKIPFCISFIYQTFCLEEMHLTGTRNGGTTTLNEHK